jgi:uncharacterized membrane protein YfcA
MMALEIGLIFILFLIGLGVSFICSMVGLGGGVLYIPILILIFHVPSQDAVGISIFCMTMTTISATIGYARNKFVDWRLSVAYDLFDVPGVFLGAYMTTLIDDLVLQIICGAIIMSIALVVLFGKTNSKAKEISTPVKIENLIYDGKSQKEKTRVDYSFAWKGSNFKWVVLSSFFGGLITGMVGTGGGTVDTTTMILLGVPMNIAAGSSHFAMLLTNITGLISHSSLGNILWDYALPIGFFSLVGAQLGSKVAPKINKKVLRKLLGVIAFLTGIRLLLSF